jgi:hypothetical protein
MSAILSQCVLACVIAQSPSVDLSEAEAIRELQGGWKITEKDVVSSDYFGDMIDSLWLSGVHSDAGYACQLRCFRYRGKVTGNVDLHFTLQSAKHGIAFNAPGLDTSGIYEIEGDKLSIRYEYGKERRKSALHFRRLTKDDSQSAPNFK